MSIISRLFWTSGRKVNRACTRRRGTSLLRPWLECLEDRCLLSFGIAEFPTLTGNTNPTGITTGPDGNLWFTEATGNQIGRITPSGAMTEFKIPTADSYPFSITTGPDHNLWFTEQDVGQIGRITTSGAVTEFKLPSNTSRPFGITTGPDGNIWFTETASDKVGRITPAGAISEFQQTAGSAPKGITAAPDGNVWFTENGTGKYDLIRPSGAVVHFSLAPTDFPTGITAGPDGNLWLTATGGNYIARITMPGGVPLTKFNVPTPQAQPFGITAGPDGNLWFTELATDKIGRITPTGTIMDFAVAPNSQPEGITTGPDGNVWFTEFQGNKIAHTSPSSALLSVVAPSFPTDALHFHTLQDAVTAAVGTHDTIQVEPGASAGDFNDTMLATAAAAGDTAITTLAPITPSEVISVGTETALVDAVAPAAGSRYSLTLHNPLANAHAAGTNVTNAKAIGIANSVTIQGDPNALPAPVPNLEIWPGTIQVVLQNLSVQKVTLDAGTAETQISNSILNLVLESGGPGNGLNVFSGNTVTDNGIFNLTGNNSASGIPTGDQILNNRFLGGARILLENDDGALIQGNSFQGQPANGVGLSVDDSLHVTVLQNRFALPGGSQNKALRVEFVTKPTSALVLNNVLGTSGLGTGLFINVGVGAQFEVLVQGNDFRGNVVGVEIVGDTTSAGATDLGGGSAGDLGTSLGGNNFRTYTASGTASGVFAIYMHNTGATATVSSQNNLWSVTDPNTVVKDGTHNTNVGGGNPGTGTINVGTTQLTADQQFVQALYDQFLQRSGAVAELNGWVAQLPTLGRAGVANSIGRAEESLRRLVDTFYLKFLNRPADFGGETGWTVFIQHGGTAEQVMANFLSSPEYYDHATALSGSPNPDANFIQIIYLQVLGRPASGSDISSWLGKLPALGRNGVAAAVIGSPEARTDQVLQFYITLLHRTARPAAAELAFWLNSSLDFLGMEVQFAASQEFYSKG